MDGYEYRSLIGRLMYLMIGTRPDLAFTVSTFSKFNASPTEVQFANAKRVLRYLKGTRTLALSFQRKKDNVQDHAILSGFTDSD